MTMANEPRHSRSRAPTAMTVEQLHQQRQALSKHAQAPEAIIKNAQAALTAITASGERERAAVQQGRAARAWSRRAVRAWSR